MILLAASLFLTNPAPLDMPRASGYLIREKDATRLEDRFDVFDLWTSQTVDGRWVDDEGRVFLSATLDTRLPTGGVSTRGAYERARLSIDRRDEKARRAAIAALSPVELAEKPRPPRQLPRGYKDVDYWQATNASTIVCAYLPLKEKTWRLAIWELVDGDDFDAAVKTFEDEYLDEPLSRDAIASDAARLSERELLRRDAAHSVDAYASWRVTHGENFVVLDDLPTRDLAMAYTNDLTSLTKRFVEVLPAPIDATNTLCVARIYATREEYLEALGTSGLTNLTWSAAYWSPQRRELVAHADPDAGFRAATLLKTLRHESFHQYLSYATAFVPTSPWLNEGYAQFFEDPDRTESAFGDLPHHEEALERYSLFLPTLLLMDYDEFYAGSDEERRLKYALARSIAVFLEDGAPKIRFQPFRNVKRDYLAALLKTRDLREATARAFPTKELLTKFVGEWLNYWKSRP